MARKTPQQKKRDSYLKDRRSNYGEHSKSSRVNIRRHKRHVNRANRRAATQALASAVGDYESYAIERAEARLGARRPKTWTKVPDAPLAQIVEKKLKRRVKMGIDSSETVHKKVERIRRRTK